MTQKRRYGEDEVNEIFALAANTGEAALPVPAEPTGLTLEELQEVGREVGLAPERVAEAAAAVQARADVLPRQKSLGAPVSVGRVVPLPRAATDREWGVLVAELRETFDAAGRIASHGDIREWTNGNLHALLEPTETGHRLRLGTRKNGTGVVTAIGAVGFVLGVLLLATRGLDAATFRGVFEMLIPAMMAVTGGGVAAGNVFSLRRWANQRERQMEHIAARTLQLLSEPPSESAD